MITEFIREKASELGFHQVGFAPAEIPEHATALQVWLNEGMVGEMRYMAREPAQRIDPRIYWPAARTIIALSLSYAPLEPDIEAGPLQGRIARYARADDYHDVIKRQLHLLGHFVREELPGSTHIAVVDTSALLERAHAVRAGLGWFGKNSMLLSQHFGSYNLLGFVLIDRELPVDSPVPPRCGTCNRCLDACPTGAIVRPHVVDARRCISYLTIELRGAVPRQFRSSLQEWIFGCDVCQEVCPWVEKAGQPRPAGLLTPRSGRAVLDLETIAGEDQEKFSARWRRSPVKRAKRVGLARNVAMVLGTSPDRDRAVSVLTRMLEDGSPLVREHAVWALGRQGGARARGVLERLLGTDPVEEVRAETQHALVRYALR